MGVFNQRFEALFPQAGALGCMVCSLPAPSPPPPPGLSMRECGAVGSASCSLACPIPQSATSLGRGLAMSPLCSGCPSPPLLPVWMKVSSLSPWLSDFHTVRFSVSSGCFFVFKLLLSFFWLCKEAQCVYLCLHLGQKQINKSLKKIPPTRLSLHSLWLFRAQTQMLSDSY